MPTICQGMTLTAAALKRYRSLRRRIAHRASRRPQGVLRQSSIPKVAILQVPKWELTLVEKLRHIE